MVGINGTRNGVRHQPERTGLVILALATLIAVLPGTLSPAAEDGPKAASAGIALQLVIPDSLAVQSVSQTIPQEDDAGNLQTASIHSVLLEWHLRSGTQVFVRPTLRTAEQTYAVLPVPGFLRLEDLQTAAAIRAFAPERDLPATLLGAAADSLEKPRGRAAIIFGSEPSAQNEPAVLTISFAAF